MALFSYLIRLSHFTRGCSPCGQPFSTRFWGAMSDRIALLPASVMLLQCLRSSSTPLSHDHATDPRPHPVILVSVDGLADHDKADPAVTNGLASTLRGRLAIGGGATAARAMIDPAESTGDWSGIEPNPSRSGRPRVNFQQRHNSGIVAPRLGQPTIWWTECFVANRIWERFGRRTTTPLPPRE